MKRNISRIKAMIKLYEYDLLKTEDNLDNFDKLLEEVTFENIEYDKDFSEFLYNGVINNLSKIDKTLAICLDNYSLDRVSYVDRALLRIGAFELMYTSIPSAIIINEIINLSKDYSEIYNFNTSKFNNGVLDKLSKYSRGSNNG